MLWDKDICLGVCWDTRKLIMKNISRFVVTLFPVLIYFWCPLVGILQISSLLYFRKVFIAWLKHPSEFTISCCKCNMIFQWSFQVWLSILTTFWTSILYLLPLVLFLIYRLMNQLTISHNCLVDAGGTKKVCFTCKLAARVHHGRHTGSAEKGDGFSSQSQASSAPGRHLFLAYSDDPNLCCCVMTLEV